MLLQIHPKNPDPRKVQIVIDCLNNGGVIIYPTDTIYGLGCDIYQNAAIERICRIKNIRLQESNFSIICHNFSHLSEFTKPIDTPVFRVMKKALPGPFTFILRANGNVPKVFKTKKKTVGIRIPDNNICREIVKELSHPIVSTSLHDTDRIIDYITDPEIIHEKYRDVVDIVVDGGFGKNKPSTIVDCSDGSFTILRQGLGIMENYL
jgi:tRNA threonylcarbamoyl adenosine modification protein (Sua5/YciO/YrdC/YwlC family)